MKTTLKLVLAISLLSLTSLAQASDHWDNCSDAAGNIKIGNGQIQLAGQESESLTYKILGKTVLKKTQQSCVLKQSGQKVISYENEDNVQRIEIRSAGRKSLAYVICSVGGSGIPANDDCR
jgi:opacity protein-like surface antigen